MYWNGTHKRVPPGIKPRPIRCHIGPESDRCWQNRPLYGLLTHLPWTKWPPFWQLTFSDEFSRMNMVEFRLKCGVGVRRCGWGGVGVCCACVCVCVCGGGGGGGGVLARTREMLMSLMKFGKRLGSSAAQPLAKFHSDLIILNTNLETVKSYDKTSFANTISKPSLGITRTPLNIKTVFPRYWIPMLKIRRLRDHLIFNTGIHILVGRHLYIETPQVSWTIVTRTDNFSNFYLIHRLKLDRLAHK